MFVKMSQLQGEKQEIIKMIKGQLVYVDVTFRSKCLVWDERCKNSKLNDIKGLIIVMS